jgi:hypothetical protein
MLKGWSYRRNCNRINDHQSQTDVHRNEIAGKKNGRIIKQIGSLRTKQLYDHI